MRDDPTLWGVHDDGNECFHGMPVPRIAYFPSLDKAVASFINAAKATLSDTNDGIGPERSAKDWLWPFAYRRFHKG